MPIDGPGRDQLRALAVRLKDAGEDGQGLRREFLKQVGEAARPLAKKIASVEHLKPYMPDRYAEVLAADLTVGAQRILAKNPRVSITAKAQREKRRKVRLLDDGFIDHPVFATGLRETWRWVHKQTGGMKPGFFTDPCEEATPDIREKVLTAITVTARKITGG